MAEHINDDSPFAAPPSYPAAAQAGHSKAGCGSGCLWVLAAGGFLLAFISLAVNVALVAVVFQRLVFIRTTLDQSLTALDAMSGSDVVFNFPISQTIDFEDEIQIKQEFVFPFKADVPVNTIIRVPVDLGPLGTQTIDVPVNTTLPVDIQVPVKIDQTFPIKLKVPVQMNVPICLSSDQPPLREWLKGVREFLILLREQF